MWLNLLWMVMYMMTFFLLALILLGGEKAEPKHSGVQKCGSSPFPVSAAAAATSLFCVLTGGVSCQSDFGEPNPHFANP